MEDAIGEHSFERGVQLQKARRFAEAAEIYRRLARDRLTVNLAVNLGVCLAEIGDRAGAVRYLGMASRHDPSNGNLHRMLAIANAEAGQTELAEAGFRAALAIKPDDPATRSALAGLYLSLGRFAEGWALDDARFALAPDRTPAVRASYPEWRGEPLNGKSLLVWVEQGFGDQIQMCRFVTMLKAQGAARVSVGCQPELAPLFSTLAGADDIIPAAAGTKVEVARHDYWSHYFSLPRYLHITLENLPASPYLKAPADRHARWGRSGRLGLAWRASSIGFNAGNKDLPDELAQRLFTAGAISLHPEDTGARDFADTAAIIESLDLVISVDTAVAHLAGAMGKPCWTLLPYIHCDWRWLRGRTDSPWYPTMRLYRQTRPGDWSEIIDEVLRGLRDGSVAQGPPRA